MFLGMNINYYRLFIQGMTQALNFLGESKRGYKETEELLTFLNHPVDWTSHFLCLSGVFQLEFRLDEGAMDDSRWSSHTNGAGDNMHSWSQPKAN